VLLALAIAATLLLWYLAVGQHASVARSRLRALLSIGRRKLAVVNHGEPEVPTGVALVHRFVGDADASREEPPAPVSVAAAPTADADESDELGWLEAEVERARQAHDVVSLLLVQAASAAAAAREEVAADAVASAVDDAFHDVPRKLRRDGETVSVILPHTLAEGARHRAARVALFLPNESWALSIAASLRTAVACFPRDAATAEELLRICQQALRD
jgi:hypothetical protein